MAPGHGAGLRVPGTPPAGGVSPLDHALVPGSHDALLLVDIQRDFCPGGALAVADGDAVVAVANRLQPAFAWVIATQDWHPAAHASFAANHPGGEPGETVELDGLQQILWPVHCVQGTAGAAFHPDLDMRPVSAVVRKGTEERIDSYSGFWDNGRRRTTGLAGLLRGMGVARVWVMGLATDYCVRFTALDAVSEGFETLVVADGCRGVELQDGDTAAALGEMADAGIRVVNSMDVGA